MEMVRGIAGRSICRTQAVNNALSCINFRELRRRFSVNSVVGPEWMGMNNALQLLDELPNSGQAGCISDVNHILTGLVRNKKYQDAIVMYRRICDGIVPEFSTLTMLMNCYCSLGFTDYGFGILAVTLKRGYLPNDVSYSLLIRGLCCVGELERAKFLFTQMKRRGIILDMETYSVLIRGLCQSGELEEAKVMYVEMKKNSNNYPDPVIYNSVIDGLRTSGNVKVIECNEKDLQEVCSILQMSDEWYLVQEALEKCTIQFTAELVKEVLQASVRIGYIALCFFAWVAKQAGYSHTTDTYNIAIKIAGGAKDFKHMRTLFYEMRRNGFFITSHTWTIMIMQYARVGLTDTALSLFEEMKDSGGKPTKSVYKYAIIFLCQKKGRKVSEAITTFQEMLREGHVVDKDLVETYLECLCEENRLLEAKNCVESLKKVGYTGSLSCSLYIRALCRAKKLDEALSFLEKVKTANSSLDKYTYGSIVHSLLLQGRLADASAKVDSMRKIGFEPTVHVYTSFIVHYFKEKQVEKAVEVFNEMKSQGVHPTVVTYSALIRGYSETGRIKEAWDVFNTLKRIGPSPDFKTYSMFMHCLCKVGRSEEALKLLTEMPAAHMMPSAVNFRTVYFGLNREAKYDVALSVLQLKSSLKSKRRFTY